MGKRLIFRYYLCMCGDAGPVFDALEEANKISLVNQNKSGEYCNDENLIKFGNSISYEVFGWYLEFIKREQE